MKYGKYIMTFVFLCVMFFYPSENASASTSKPYGSYSTTISGGFIATSTITKCSCNPVNNYLMAAIQVQYKSDGNYYWIPSSTTYYYDSGYNTESKSKSITHSGITYAKGWFKARCGSGSVKEYYDTATN
ncbi:MAG: hypothetical protein NC393_05855 [Clostridium sp.]|nr:hypothetical protein [Clostridium sp.]MCM1171638.1 hypothetical protein [Clostridium sp.]MCM1209164.1 hypothetical protein [Ruminococcus sp.]